MTCEDELMKTMVAKTTVFTLCLFTLMLAPVFSSADAKGDVAAGEKIYKANCDMCHFANKTEKKIGPGLKGLFANKKLSSGKPTTDENVRTQIEKGGKMMPAFGKKLSAEDVDSLMAYLKTL
jgi:cytochrome c